MDLTLTGTSVFNDGPLYIGRDPWYNGPTNWGMDNFQIHNKALSAEEITRCIGGEMLYSENLVLGYDFNEGYGNDRVLYDVSNFKNDGGVEGNPSLGGNDRFLSVDGVDDMLVVEHTEALYLGKDGADFTVSFALL